MSKSGDPKVKKTLIRNYEVKVKPSSRKQVVHDVACFPQTSEKSSSSSVGKENELSQPSLCSSGLLADYVDKMRKIKPSPLKQEDINRQLGAKITKKLNFHFNDAIYKNLVELNCIEANKGKKERRPSGNVTSSKKDLEPNIEDFCEHEKDTDSPPSIPILKLKSKPIKKVESGQLHKLVAALENL